MPGKHFFVTFGVNYAHEPHPYWPGAHPTGTWKCWRRTRSRPGRWSGRSSA
jgi:hypothetical protein